MIGIDDNKGFVYEGDGSYGYAIWPTPLIIPAAIVDDSALELKPSKGYRISDCPYVFREDSYDSVSRIRRGRLYSKSDFTQPSQWYVSPHPVLNENLREMDADGHLRKSLFNLTPFHLISELKRIDVETPIILLGTAGSFTIWSLVGAETFISGDEAVILRARQTIGALPRVIEDAIPGKNRVRVLEYIRKLEEEIYRAGPESVVDSAREVATAILSAFLQDVDEVDEGKDLGELAKKMEKHKKYVVENMAKIIARLHSRRKHSEQERRQIRAITEQDAEFVIHGVGVMLCDLGWAKW